MMYSEDTTGQETKTFLDEFAQRKKLFPSPDDNLTEARDSKGGRWPTFWDSRVRGIPSMEVAGKERGENYL